jgi:hypothetical protein
MGALPSGTTGRAWQLATGLVTAPRRSRLGATGRRPRPASALQRIAPQRDAVGMRRSTATARLAGRGGPDTEPDTLVGEMDVLDAPLRFVVPLAGPFGALLLLAMAWLSLP